MIEEQIILHKQSNQNYLHSTLKYKHLIYRLLDLYTYDSILENRKISKLFYFKLNKCSAFQNTQFIFDTTYIINKLKYFSHLRSPFYFFLNKHVRQQISRQHRRQFVHVIQYFLKRRRTSCNVLYNKQIIITYDIYNADPLHRLQTVIVQQNKVS